MKTKSYQEDLINDLKDPAFALEYLNACLNGGDEGTFLLGLRYVAEAHGGVRSLAKKTYLSREHLFKMLSKKATLVLKASSCLRMPLVGDSHLFRKTNERFQAICI